MKEIANIPDDDIPIDNILKELCAFVLDPSPTLATGSSNSSDAVLPSPSPFTASVPENIALAKTHSLSAPVQTAGSRSHSQGTEIQMRSAPSSSNFAVMTYSAVRARAANLKAIWAPSEFESHAKLDRCLLILETELKFNAPQWKSSHYANHDERQRSKAPASHILYACQSWVKHLAKSSLTVGDVERVERMLRTKFLFWLDVMSFLKKSEDVWGLLRTVWTSCRQVLGHNSSFLLFIHCAFEFVYEFSRWIQNHAPHIYLSALAWTRRSSSIAQAFQYLFPHTLKLVPGPEDPTLIMRCLSSVYCVAVSPNGKIIASGNGDGMIHLWDLDTGELVLELLVEGDRSSVNSITFSPDGKFLASASDSTIRIWEVQTGRETREPLRGHSSCISSIAFSVDEALLVSADLEGKILLWKTETWKVIMKLKGYRSPHMRSIESVAFSHNDTRIASNFAGDTVRVWNTTTGNTMATLKGHGATVRSVAFSPDDRRIVSGSDDGTVRVWDLESGISAPPFTGHRSHVSCVQFSHDGKTVASCSDDQTIRVWDANSGEEVLPPLEGHMDAVNSISFSTNGKYMISGSKDATVRVWDMETGKAALRTTSNGHRSYPIPVLRHSGWIQSVAFSPDDACVASGSADCTICVWDTKTGSLLAGPFKGHSDSVTAVCFARGGLNIISCSLDRTIRLWDSSSGHCLIVQSLSHAAQTLVVSRDGKHVVSGGEGGTVQIRDADTLETVRELSKGHKDSVTCVAFSPNNKHVASVSGSHRTVHLWDAETGQFIRQLKEHTLGVTSVVFLEDNKHVVSGSHDSTIIVYDIATGKMVGEPLKGHTAAVVALTASPDGRLIASASWDRTIRFWSTTTREAVGRPLYGHAEWVRSISFSPDSARLVSGGDDRVIRMWNVAEGPPYTSLPGVLFSEDPQHALAVDDLLESTDVKDRRDLFSYQQWRGPWYSLRPYGWIQGPQGERLLFVPEERQAEVWWPRTCAIMGVQKTCLDFSSFPHGEDWTECFSGGQGHA